METLSVTLHKQPWICVLDPILMLCSRGLQGIGLTRQLGHSLELWVVRELWHILDDTPLYLSQRQFTPGDRTLDYGVTRDVLPAPVLPMIDVRSLQAWSHIRQTTDLGGYQFYWLGDGVSQSRLPAWLKQGKTPDSRLQQYELLAQSLEASTASETISVHQPLVAACRDAAALAAALGSSFILAVQPQTDEPPYIVQYLEHWGIACQQRPASDAIVALEKNLFHQLFVQSGLAKLLWSNTLQLAIVHLNIPAAFDPNLLVPKDDSTGDDDGPSDYGTDFGTDFGNDYDAEGPSTVRSSFSPRAESPWELENIPLAGANLWEGAQVFWYPLTQHPLMATAHANSSAIASEAVR